MKIIKLDAIDSTNSFLKDLSRNSTLENFTTVVSKYQTKGRGQQGDYWISADGKNLTFSTFVSFVSLELHQHKYLNFAISIAILEVLKHLGVVNLKIKWPNDILAGNDKISGILIENSIKNKKIQSSVIGIGINVNQLAFPIFNRNATSLKKCLQKDFDLKELLNIFIKKIQIKVNLLNIGDFDALQEQYLNYLYKINVPTTFKDKENVLFMGIIIGISNNGKLRIRLENDSIKEFGIKEVSFA